MQSRKPGHNRFPPHRGEAACRSGGKRRVPPESPRVHSRKRKALGLRYSPLYRQKAVRRADREQLPDRRKPFSSLQKNLYLRRSLPYRRSKARARKKNAASAQSGDETVKEETEMKLQIGNTVLTAVLAENDSARALTELLRQGPLTIAMEDYGRMEKVGDLGTSLPRCDESITTSAGDLILYQGSSFVIYYAQNSWSLTRLGRIQDITADGLREILGKRRCDSYTFACLILFPKFRCGLTHRRKRERSLAAKQRVSVFVFFVLSNRKFCSWSFHCGSGEVVIK